MNSWLKGYLFERQASGLMLADFKRRSSSSHRVLRLRLIACGGYFRIV